MKLLGILGSLALALTLALSSAPADAAKRLGGGKSVGQQSNNVKKDATPAAPAATPAAAGAAGAAAAATKKPWGAMLGGLAAGLGLAWLASSLGLGGAMANILMFALIALAVVAVIGFVMRKRAANGQGGQGNNGGLAYQGAGAGNAQSPAQYSPSTVGNDASARPWERNSMAFEAPQTGSSAPAAASGSMIGANLRQASGWTIPADFDQAGFLTGSKQSFMTLQSAWDKSDMGVLRSMMTDEMLTEVRGQLAERDAATGATANHTNVSTLDAKLLGIEDLGSAWLASVEFGGMISEEVGQAPQPFREVWNMTKLKGGGGWLVAGIQALS